MALSPEQEQVEHELRMETMSVGIEQMRANVEQMRTNGDKLRNDIRYEGRKFFLQALVAAAACVGAGVALANWVNGRPVPTPSVQVAPAPAPSTPRG